MKIAQIILICLCLWGLGVTTARHGKPKKGNENAWSTLISTLILFGLLYWGGFWDCLLK